MKSTVKSYSIATVIEKDEDGYYAYCPQLQGCHTCGDTYEEARANIAEAIQACLEDMLANGEDIPAPASLNLTMVEVAV